MCVPSAVQASMIKVANCLQKLAYKERMEDEIIQALRMRQLFLSQLDKSECLDFFGKL